MEYKDKAGTVVKKGDILYYNEDESMYSSSIHLVTVKDKEMYARSVICNFNGQYKIVDYIDEVGLKYYTDLEENILMDAIIIGNKKKNPEMLKIEYMNENYPLKNPAT